MKGRIRDEHYPHRGFTGTVTRIALALGNPHWSSPSRREEERRGFFQIREARKASSPRFQRDGD